MGHDCSLIGNDGFGRNAGHEFSRHQGAIQLLDRVTEWTITLHVKTLWDKKEYWLSDRQHLCDGHDMDKFDAYSETSDERYIKISLVDSNILFAE